MSSTPNPLAEENPLALVLAGAAVVGLVIAKADDVAAAALGFLVEHGVLTRSEVVVEIPATDGAGLDVARLAIVACVLVLVTLAITAAVRRRLNDRARPARTR